MNEILRRAFGRSKPETLIDNGAGGGIARDDSGDGEDRSGSGSQSEHGSNREVPKESSPLFFSDDSPYAQPSSGPRTQQQISVAVPAAGLYDNGDREVLDDFYSPSVVREILQESDRTAAVQYRTQFKNGQVLWLPYEQLEELPGFAKAFDHYRKTRTPSASPSLITDPETYTTDEIMVTTQPNKRKRDPPQGFVDISKYDVSDVERTTRRSSRRPVQPRKVLEERKGLRRGSDNVRPNYQIELGSSVETSEDELGTRREHPQRSSSRQMKTVNYLDTLAGDFDDDSENSAPLRQKRGRALIEEPNRRSQRSGRQKESMRELDEDDITERPAAAATIAKAVGAKEVFQPTPSDSEFRLRHLQICDTCYDYDDSEEKGILVFCQGCSLSYHQQCLGVRSTRDHLVTKIGKQNFVLQCRRCVEVARKKDPLAPRQGYCQKCHIEGTSSLPFRERKSMMHEQKEREDNRGEDPDVLVLDDLLNNPKNVLFRCIGCQRAWHMQHLPSRREIHIGEGHENEDEAAAQRFLEYGQDWHCNECNENTTKIDGLVAWRPLDVDTYVLGTTTEQVEEDAKEYLVHWQDMSYYQTKWLPGSWVWGVTAAAMRKAFMKRDDGANLPKMTTEDAIPEDYLRADIVFEVKYTNVVTQQLLEVDLARVKEVAKARMKFKGLPYEEVVWEAPPDPDDTERWNDFVAAYEEWVYGRYVKPPNKKTYHSHMARIRQQDFATKVEMKTQPDTLKGGELMKYQLDGMNWLLFQWYKQQNAILADEMGLGKTIQVIAFLATLQQKHRCWPFLIVVPDATCANWRREIKLWAPSLRVVMYFGSAKARELANKHELFPEGASEVRCHVVVTSYNAAQDVDSQRILRKIPWQGLIVDEGQRLKNENSLLYSALNALKFPFKLLLTGTPLQNNQRELFNLLQFLDSNISAQDMETEYAELTKDNLPKLHDQLRPFFLRRTKAQVLTFLPPVAQIIVPVSLSPLQRELYKSVLAKNADLLKAIFGADSSSKTLTKVTGMKNLLMQLRKCLCHPFVYSIEIEEKNSNAAISHKGLVEASSKLSLLEIMLPKLKERGHRVLIFSQFLDMLTIIEDFLDGLAMVHTRIDGSMGSLDKQKRIDAYNAPDSEIFACLLSTRAGGVGINLATADTVIILDPDFNPHQDIQALSRAHRIGQKNKVLVFQLMTRGTAEEKIMQIGKKKMAMDHVLIEQMDAPEIDGNDLESVLRFGAEALFKDDAEAHDIHYDSASVDKLLDRAQIENTDAGSDKSAESQFSFARIWANDTGTTDKGFGTASDDEPQQPPDPTVWERILQERARQAAIDSKSRVETFGRGKRQRKTLVDLQASDEYDAPERPSAHESDDDFQERAVESEPESAGEDGEQQVDPAELADKGGAAAGSRSQLINGKVSSKPPRAKAIRKDIPLPSRPFIDLTMEDVRHPCIVCNDHYGAHERGHCPLKLAGVEVCNLCGEAHFGGNRACETFTHEMSVRMMLKSLGAESPEDAHLKAAAKKYLQGVLGHLVSKKKVAERGVGQQSGMFFSGQGHGHNVDGGATANISNGQNNGAFSSLPNAPQPQQQALSGHASMPPNSNGNVNAPIYMQNETGRSHPFPYHAQGPELNGFNIPRPVSGGPTMGTFPLPDHSANGRQNGQSQGFQGPPQQLRMGQQGQMAAGGNQGREGRPQ
ncbi:hypothetical protein MMC25_005534 [Agyrium rufum]|nr:hypothetical protein [Agyrium rufum]